MLKRRPSKRFVLAESGEDSTWDPTAESEEPAGPIPLISEPVVEKENNEVLPASEQLTVLEMAAAAAARVHAEEQTHNTKLLRVTTAGGLKYVTVTRQILNFNSFL